MKGLGLPSIVAAAALVGGCAGIVAPFVKNPYAGNYRGTFDTNNGRNGTASVDLTNIGNVFGELTDAETGEVGKLEGSVSSGGTFGGSVAFPGESHALSGSFDKDSKDAVLRSSDGYRLTLKLGDR